MSSYKRLLSEIHADKPSPTKEQIERCLANAAHHQNDAVDAVNAVASQVKREPKCTLAQRHAALLKKKQVRATKAGMTISQWETRARTYYSIDAQFVVTSIAASPDPSKAKQWGPFSDLVEAEEKVLELLDYKYHDHHGRNDRPLNDFKW